MKEIPISCSLAAAEPDQRREILAALQERCAEVQPLENGLRLVSKRRRGVLADIHPRAAMRRVLFLIPGVGETLRVNGKARISADPELLQRFSTRAEAAQHSDYEHRFFALRQTDAGRWLFVAYVLRGDKIRVISARDMTRREQKEYESARIQELETDPEV